MSTSSIPNTLLLDTSISSIHTPTVTPSLTDLHIATIVHNNIGETDVNLDAASSVSGILTDSGDSQNDIGSFATSSDVKTLTLSSLSSSSSAGRGGNGGLDSASATNENYGNGVLSLNPLNKIDYKSLKFGLVLGGLCLGSIFSL
ncbi:unnamed protein product [Candida verbasci]|uniref:Uncharacterized protein n=1 Tax=Candida verbasci TaxID=1227364 RepID=A0A9W4XET1_9ASCO|nr:unnamed protein product [Candida verbasci]